MRITNQIALNIPLAFLKNKQNSYAMRNHKIYLVCIIAHNAFGPFFEPRNILIFLANKNYSNMVATPTKELLVCSYLALCYFCLPACVYVWMRNKWTHKVSIPNRALSRKKFASSFPQIYVLSSGNFRLLFRSLFTLLMRIQKENSNWIKTHPNYSLIYDQHKHALFS